MKNLNKIYDFNKSLKDKTIEESIVDFEKLLNSIGNNRLNDLGETEVYKLELKKLHKFKQLYKSFLDNTRRLEKENNKLFKKIIMEK